MAGYGGVVETDPYQPGDKDPVAGVWALTGQHLVGCRHQHRRSEMDSRYTSVAYITKLRPI